MQLIGRCPMVEYEGKGERVRGKEEKEREREIARERDEKITRVISNMHEHEM